MKIADGIVIGIGIGLGLLRVYVGVTIVPVTPTMFEVYKDVAHLYVGGLAVAMWTQKQKWQIVLFIALCVLEVLVATISRI